MRHLPAAACALILAAGLTGPAAAQTPRPAPQPAAKPAPAPGDEDMSDVDPALLAQCRQQATEKRLKGEARSVFLKSCVQPED